MSTLESPNLKSRIFLGSALLALGSALFLGSLTPLALQFHYLLDRSGASLLGFLPALGLVFLRSLHAAALHQVHYFSLLLRILVSFSAILVAGAGIRVIGSRSGAGSAMDHYVNPQSSRGNRR
jgi:hypothetical protein